jgi:predicted nucleic-acid-binding Zn-ribbon protein
MVEVMKCPKCGSEMPRGNYVCGYRFNGIRLVKFGDFQGDKLVPFYCPKCGYVELYNEKNVGKGDNGFTKRSES